MLFVSHNMQAVQQMCDNAIYLSAGRKIAGAIVRVVELSRRHTARRFSGRAQSPRSCLPIRVSAKKCVFFRRDELLPS